METSVPFLMATIHFLFLLSSHHSPLFIPLLILSSFLCFSSLLWLTYPPPDLTGIQWLTLLLIDLTSASVESIGWAKKLAPVLSVRGMPLRLD